MTKKNPMLVPQLRFPEFQQEHAWENKKLELALSPVIRKRPKPAIPYLGIGLRSHGKGTFLKPDEPPEKNSMDFFYEVKENDLIINITFAWEGAIAIAGKSDDGALASHRFPTYIFKRDTAIPEFFRYTILNKQFIYQLGVISPGGAGRNRVLNKKDFLKLGMYMPNTPEQQKIADCLGSLDDLIAAHSRKLAALQDHQKGLLQQLFPAEGETTPKLRFPEFEGEWTTTQIGEFGKVVTGSTPATSKREFYDGPRMFVSPADISGQQFVEKTNTTLTHLGFEKTRPIRAGSTLFVCIGSTIGKVAQNREECATNQQINAVIPSKRFSDAFVFYCLLRHSKTVASFAGNQAVPIINKSLFSSLSLLVPEKPEQQKIADCLSDLDTLITAETEQIAALKAHKKGLMQQLFPNPNTQPIST